MVSLIYLISFFWFIRTFKFVLFWIYLWQLKEYHAGRFIDHFRTYKGKALLLDTVFLLKIIFLLILVYSKILPDDPPYDSWLRPMLLGFFGLFFLYAIEAIKTVGDFLQNNIRKPIFTTKVIFLFSAAVAFTILFFLFVLQNRFDIFLLVLFDLMLPITISLVVLFFQPFFVLFRNNILRKAVKKILQFHNLTVIGITGSYGKTSTKEFLTTILSKKFNVLATKDHQNSEIGIAQTILNNLNKKHQIFIAEMGSYNKGGIKLLCDIVKPKIGVVTGVNEQHLATFGSMENLLSAEGGRELLNCLPRHGLLIVNGDNKYCLDLYKKALRQYQGKLKTKVYTVDGKKIDSDVFAEEITVHENSLDFMAVTKEKEAVHFNVKVLGKQNIQNLLGAILVSKQLGMNLEEIALACKSIKPEQAGMTLNRGAHGINIIDSSYSSNPDGVMADLEYLNIFTGKKALVMPCLIELGKKSSEVHYNIGKKIAEVCDLAIVTTKDKFKEIKMGAVTAGMAENQILLCDGSAGSPQANEILNHITTFCKDGDAVLLEGRIPKELIKLLSLS